MTLLALAPAVRRLNSQQCGPVVGSRWGIMLHYDDSSTDKGAVSWFLDPRCKVSYNGLYLDNGDRVDVAPWDRAAWHAGVCLPGSWGTAANSAFYGLSAATNGETPVTVAQLDAIVRDCAAICRAHGWGAGRIMGHDMLACFPQGHPKAGQLGRKIDPTGPNKAKPILSVEMVRQLVAARLMAELPSTQSQR